MNTYTMVVNGEEVRVGIDPSTLAVLQDGVWTDVPLEPDDARLLGSARSPLAREAAVRHLRRWRSWLWRGRALFPWPARYDDGLALAVDGATEFRLYEDGRLERYVQEELTVCHLADLDRAFDEAFHQRDCATLASILRLVAPRQPPTYRQQLREGAIPLMGLNDCHLAEREFDGRYVSGCLLTAASIDGVRVTVVLLPTDPFTPRVAIRGVRLPLDLGRYAEPYHLAARRYRLGSMLAILHEALQDMVTAYLVARCPSCAQVPGTIEIDGRRYCVSCVVDCVAGHPMVAQAGYRCAHCRRRMCVAHTYYCDHCNRQYCPHHFDRDRQCCRGCAGRHHLDGAALRNPVPLEGFEGVPSLGAIRAQLPLALPRGWTAIAVVDQPRRIVVRATSAVPTLEDYQDFPLQPFVATLTWAVAEGGEVLTTSDNEYCDGLLHVDGPHPHLSDGVPCWGNLGAPWHIAKESGEIDVMLTVVFDFLSSYNPQSAYDRLGRMDAYRERWERYFPGSCDFCQRLLAASEEYRTFDDTRCCPDCLGTCDRCGDRRPADWLSPCAECDAPTCSRCACFCSRCGDMLCPDHATPCRACSRLLCHQHRGTCSCGDRPDPTPTVEELPY